MDVVLVLLMKANNRRISGTMQWHSSGHQLWAQIVSRVSFKTHFADTLDAALKEKESRGKVFPLAASSPQWNCAEDWSGQRTTCGHGTVDRSNCSLALLFSPLLHFIAPLEVSPLLVAHLLAPYSLLNAKLAPVGALCPVLLLSAWLVAALWHAHHRYFQLWLFEVSTEKEPVHWRIQSTAISKEKKCFLIFCTKSGIVIDHCLNNEAEIGDDGSESMVRKAKSCSDASLPTLDSWQLLP